MVGGQEKKVSVYVTTIVQSKNIWGKTAGSENDRRFLIPKQAERDMEASVLTDKNIFPTEDVIFSHLGKSKTLWLTLFEQMHKDYPEFAEEWKYYNDGKRWLLKVTEKKKTVFWLSVIPKGFRITFYFSDKAQKQILDSAIADELKDQYINGKRYNKIRGLTIVCTKKRDITSAELLIEIKRRLK